MTRKSPEELRSHRWFGVDSMRAFGHRSRAYEMGYTREDFAGKPVIGILAEFDALPGISNQAVARQLPLVDGHLEVRSDLHYQTRTVHTILFKVLACEDSCKKCIIMLLYLV